MGEKGEGDMTHENCSQVLYTSSLYTCVHPSTPMGFHVCAKDSCFCRKIEEIDRAYETLMLSLNAKEFELESAQTILAQSETKVRDAEKKVQDAEKEVQDAEKEKVAENDASSKRRNEILETTYSSAVNLHSSYVSSLIQEQQSLREQQTIIHQLRVDLSRLRCKIMEVGEKKVRICKCFNNAYVAD